jgi:hypothetical protein
MVIVRCNWITRGQSPIQWGAKEPWASPHDRQIVFPLATWKRQRERERLHTQIYIYIYNIYLFIYLFFYLIYPFIQLTYLFKFTYTHFSKHHHQGAVGGPLLTATGAAAEKALGQLLRQRYTRPGGCTDRFRGSGSHGGDEWGYLWGLPSGNLT